jgi:hypothetical protein
MTISQAGDWYRDALDLIPAFVAQAPTAAERLDSAWDVKSRLRLAAALALYDQQLVREWFAAFPLPHYWAPLGPRRWVVSLWESTLDVVATSAEVVGSGIGAQTTRDALRRLVFGEGD